MSWNGRTVVVTGGAGFIGSHLVERLVHEGANVTVVDNLSTGRVEHLAHVLERIQFVRASTLESHRLRRAMKGADTVFHLAAMLGVKRTWEEPVRVIHENLMGTETVLRAAADEGVQRVVHASSSEVYGDAPTPYSEESTPAAPRTGYAAAKLTEEKLCEAFHEETGLRTSSLRYFNVYGPRQEGSAYGFVTAIFARRVLAGEPPTVFGDGQQTRDFTFVADTVEGTLRSADRARDCDVLNLGTGVETSVLTLARATLHAAGRSDLQVQHTGPRKDEVRRRVAEASRARKTLEWEPYWTLERGLEETLRAMKA